MRYVRHPRCTASFRRCMILLICAATVGGAAERADDAFRKWHDVVTESGSPDERYKALIFLSGLLERGQVTDEQAEQLAVTVTKIAEPLDLSAEGVDAKTFITVLGIFEKLGDVDAVRALIKERSPGVGSLTVQGSMEWALGITESWALAAQLYDQWSTGTLQWADRGMELLLRRGEKHPEFGASLVPVLLTRVNGLSDAEFAFLSRAALVPSDHEDILTAALSQLDTESPSLIFLAAACKRALNGAPLNTAAYAGNAHAILSLATDWDRHRRAIATWLTIGCIDDRVLERRRALLPLMIQDAAQAEEEHPLGQLSAGLPELLTHAFDFDLNLEGEQMDTLREILRSWDRIREIRKQPGHERRLGNWFAAVSLTMRSGGREVVAEEVSWKGYYRNLSHGKLSLSYSTTLNTAGPVCYGDALLATAAPESFVVQALHCDAGQTADNWNLLVNGLDANSRKSARGLAHLITYGPGSSDFPVADAINKLHAIHDHSWAYPSASAGDAIRFLHELQREDDLQQAMAAFFSQEGFFCERGGVQVALVLRARGEDRWRAVLEESLDALDEPSRAWIIGLYTEGDGQLAPPPLGLLDGMWTYESLPLLAVLNAVGGSPQARIALRDLLAMSLLHVREWSKSRAERALLLLGALDGVRLSEE